MHIMKQLFTLLEEKDISYLHFKSNLNLNQSFAGKGDFDVLADRSRLGEIETVLISLGAKRYNKVRYGVYPGVDNWLLFDPETGGLYHLHLHYQLASGKYLLKEYVLPWDRFLFDTRIRDPEYGIYISHPAAELLLLTVRTVIKSRERDWIRARVNAYRLHASLQKERADLLSKADSESVAAYASRLFSPEAAGEIAALAMKETWNGKDFIRATRLVRRELKFSRKYSGFVSNVKSRALWLGDGWNKFRRRKLSRCLIEKKVTLSGGRIYAFVGVDGAGKSTTKDALYKWMYRQIESRRFYMGTGDGKVSPLAYVLKKMSRLASADETGKQKAGEGRRSERVLSFRRNPKAYVRKLASAMMINSVEKSNRKKLMQMNRYRLEGGVCFLDRYPQIEVEGKNDGPKISVLCRRLPASRLVKRWSRKEEKHLGIVREIKPDLVFRLNISAETSMARKPEQQDIEVFRQKIEDLRKISFQGARIVDIDAEQPLEDEILQIKRIIWENL